MVTQNQPVASSVNGGVIVQTPFGTQFRDPLGITPGSRPNRRRGGGGSSSSNPSFSSQPDQPELDIQSQEVESRQSKIKQLQQEQQERNRNRALSEGAKLSLERQRRGDTLTYGNALELARESRNRGFGSGLSGINNFINYENTNRTSPKANNFPISQDDSSIFGGASESSPKFLGLIDLPSIGFIQQELRERKTKKITNEVQSLSNEEFVARAERGDKGFSLFTNQSGSFASFNFSAFEPDIKSGTGSRDIIFGNAGNLTTSQKFGAVSSSIVFGLGDIGKGFVDLPKDYAKGFSLKKSENIDRRGEIPSDVLRTGTNVAFVGGTLLLGGASFVNTARVEGFAVATEEAFAGFNPLRIKPGKFGITDERFVGSFKDIGAKNSDFSFQSTRQKGEFGSTIDTFQVSKSSELGADILGGGIASRDIATISRTGRLDFQRDTDLFLFTGKAGSKNQNVLFPKGNIENLPSSGFSGDQFNILRITEKGNSAYIKRLGGREDIQGIFSEKNLIKFNKDIGNVNFDVENSIGFGGKDLLSSKGIRTNILNPNLQGKVTRIRLSGVEEDFGFIIPKGTKNKGNKFDLGLGNLQSKQIISKQTGFIIPKFQTPKQETFLDLSPLGVGGKGTSLFVGKGLYERTDFTSPRGGNILSKELKLDQGFRNKFDFAPLSFDRQGSGVPNKNKLVNFGGLFPLEKGNQDLFPRNAIINVQDFGFAQREGSKSSSININDFGRGNPFLNFGFSDFSGRKSRFGLGFNFPGIDLFEAPKPRKVGSRKYKRRPSLISLELGLTSSKPSSGEFTGLVSRPILTSPRRKRRKR